MKIIIVVVLFAVAAGVGYFVVQDAVAHDLGRMIAYAVDHPGVGAAQLDVEVTKAMIALDPPPQDLGGNWTSWIIEARK